MYIFRYTEPSIIILRRTKPALGAPAEPCVNRLNHKRRPQHVQHVPWQHLPQGIQIPRTPEYRLNPRLHLRPPRLGAKRGEVADGNKAAREAKRQGDGKNVVEFSRDTQRRHRRQCPVFVVHEQRAPQSPVRRT